MRGDRELEAMSTVFGALAQLTADEQRRVLEWVVQKLDLGGTPMKLQSGGRSDLRESSAAASGPSRAGSPSPRKFIAEKHPKTDVERVTCLAYFLTHMRDTPLFKTREITRLNAEATQPPFSNAAFAVMNATRQNQFLAPVGGGKKQITVRGEALVEALPVRERVTEALAANPLVGRKKRKGKSRTHQKRG